MPTIGGRAPEASLAMPRKGHVGFAGVPVSFAGAAVLLAVYDRPTVASVAASGRRWQDPLEERRFLAPLLIAPAVLFIALLVGVPLVLAIYLSLTDATAGSLSGDFVGLRNYLDAWDDPTFRRALKNTIIFTVVSQAIVLVCAGFLAHALVRNFRGRWLLRFLILLPWAAPVALSTVGFLWIFHSLYSVVNWTLVHDIVPGGPAFYPYKAINWAFARDFWPGFIQISPIEPIDPPQWLGEPPPAMWAGAPPRDGGDHPHPRLADHPVCDGDLHRRPRLAAARDRRCGTGRRRDRPQEVLVGPLPAAAADRPRGAPLRDRLHRDGHHRRPGADSRRAVQQHADPDHLGLRDRHQQRRARGGRCDLPLPTAAARVRRDPDALVRPQGRGHVDGKTAEAPQLRRRRPVRDRAPLPLFLDLHTFLRPEHPPLSL